MNIIQLIQDGENYGLFSCNQDKDLTEVIQLCRSRAEAIYDNEYDLELEEIFIDQLEQEGIVRIFAEEYNI